MQALRESLVPSYSESFFYNQFKGSDSEELVAKLLRGDLTTEAQSALIYILRERGVDNERFELLSVDARRSALRQGGVTNQCDFCGRTALFPLRNGVQKFCGSKCLKLARSLEQTIGLAPDIIVAHAKIIRSGPCPRCGRSGSIVEVRPMFEIVSAIWLCSRSALHELLCRRCGARKNMRFAIANLFLGWWSVPGLFLTPLFVYRNLSHALREQFGPEPSAKLMLEARLELADTLMPAIATQLSTSP